MKRHVNDIYCILELINLVHRTSKGGKTFDFSMERLFGSIWEKLRFRRIEGLGIRKIRFGGAAIRFGGAAIQTHTKPAQSSVIWPIRRNAFSETSPSKCARERDRIQSNIEDCHIYYLDHTPIHPNPI